MAAQTPILANDVGDLGRIVRSTGCGLLIESATVPAIREGLNQLRQPEVRLRLGRAGRRAAEREYSWDRAARQLTGIYNHLQ
jgi:glycosyltransferase involved in cell wall biosynthesis